MGEFCSAKPCIYSIHLINAMFLTLSRHWKAFNDKEELTHPRQALRPNCHLEIGLSIMTLYGHDWFFLLF